MKFKPEVFYPVAVIILIVVTMVGSMSVLFIARMDGGAQIEQNYYKKTVNWDDEMALDEASIRLGWQLDVQPTTSTMPSGANNFVVQVKNAKGELMDAVTGKVTASQPSKSGALGQISLAPVQNQQGSYSFSLAKLPHGLVDLTFDLHKGQDHFRKTKRINI